MIFIYMGKKNVLYEKMYILCSKKNELYHICMDLEKKNNDCFFLLWLCLGKKIINFSFIEGFCCFDCFFFYKNDFFSQIIPELFF